MVAVANQRQFLCMEMKELALNFSRTTLTLYLCFIEREEAELRRKLVQKKEQERKDRKTRRTRKKGKREKEIER